VVVQRNTSVFESVRTLANGPLCSSTFSYCAGEETKHNDLLKGGLEKRQQWQVMRHGRTPAVIHHALADVDGVYGIREMDLPGRNVTRLELNKPS
jgi:hypothetical protein